MNRCPNCGRYMSSYMEYIFGGARLIWICECGYSNKNESSSLDNRTYIAKDNGFTTTNHT